jgi:hypothetical protein
MSRASMTLWGALSLVAFEAPVACNCLNWGGRLAELRATDRPNSCARTELAG